MSTDTVTDSHFDKRYFHAHIASLWKPSLRRLHRLLRSQLFFNLIFLSIGFAEVMLFIAFFACLSQSILLAFTLAIFFMTLFSYFILRLYLQTKQPEQLMKLCEEYLGKCKEIIRYQEGIPEHHIALGNAAHKFAAALHEKEYTFYPPPFFAQSLTSPLEKFSCFCHWKQLHKMKELLLNASIEEHLKAVKCEPTNLEVHASLANAYVTLSSLYADPRKFPNFEEGRYLPEERYSPLMEEKFRITAERAIEEFKILNDYSPNDPWVHVQLAYSYHDLQMPEKEIQEYEIALSLQPEDQETLFKLGRLYFQQGLNAKGLRIYELLRQTHYKKAESLIKFYGSYERDFS